MKSRIALCAVALGATLFAADEAFAKSKKTPAQTIEMTRPSDGPDADAQGTVDVKGGKTVIHLSKLQRRSTFEIRDSGTGELLGVVKTNRKGKATFNLTKSLAKAASTNGSDAAAGDVQNVDVVDPTTGDTVLTGDTQPDPPGPASGAEEYSNDAGDVLDLYMSTDGEGGDAFGATFYLGNADPTDQTFTYYDVYLDTANGDALPLGVASVTDLAGRKFEIRSGDGTTVLSGDLPQLEADDYSFDDYGDYDFGDYGNYGGGSFDFGDYSGGCNSGGDDSSSNDTTAARGARHAGAAKSAKRGRHAKDTAADGYSLFIADANGDLQNAEPLTEETQDYSNDLPSFDPDFGFDPFSGGGFVIILVFAPSDGSFDYAGFLDSLFGGGFDPSQFDGNGGTDLTSALGMRSARHHGSHR